MTDDVSPQQGDPGREKSGNGGGGGRGGRSGKGRGGRGRVGRGSNRGGTKDNKKDNTAKSVGENESFKGSSNNSRAVNLGGRGRNRGRGNQKKGKKNDSTESLRNNDAAETKPNDNEKCRLEEDKLRKEVEEVERKQREAKEQERRAYLEAREALEKELEVKFQTALDVLEQAANAVESHKECRKAFSPEELDAARKSFEISKKSLKSDLKKCTTFVKKIKTGGAWSMKPDDIVKDVSTLNLSRYVEEVVGAILEAKLKLTDLPVALALCKAMHQRYATFLPALLPRIWSIINLKPSEETGKLRRIYVRLVTEILLYGLSTETKQLVKLITEVSGGKDGSYNVTDAHVVLAFVKSAGFEILGTSPTSIRENSAFITAEVSKVESQSERSENDVVDLDSPVLVSKDASKKGTQAIQAMNVLLKERAVSEDISKVFFTHCKGAYGTLATSLIAMDSKLKKMEKRCEQDRLLSGSLAEPREAGLQDARKLRETLWKSVETMSDILDLPMPQLEPDGDDEAEGGTGVEVWTKTAGDEEGVDFGPFDDEETRAFYFDLPDFLATIPAALLGLKEDEIEKRKSENLVKYRSDLNVQDTAGDAETAEVAPSSIAELEAAEENEGNDTVEEAELKKSTENKDTPHYKLMVLLEQELPECNRRERIDELSELFCTNHGSSKNSRKRLTQTLFLVPRTRLDLLPYYSRMATTLSRVWPEIGDSLLVELEQQFHGQAKFKKNQNMESRLRTARYISELTKFRLAPPIISLRCMRRCLDDFTGGNVDVACCLLEGCGRYLYRLPHTHEKVNSLMETMVRISKAKRLDERSIAVMNTALYTVKPPARGTKSEPKEYSPLEGYLRHLLMVSLEPTDDSISFAAKQLLRFPWDDPALQCSFLICKIMVKACRVGRYSSIYAVANVASKLRRQKPEVCVRLLDTVIEELQWSLEHPAFKDQQRTLAVARLLGELYCASLASAPLIFQQLYTFINFGHEIPNALKEASNGIVPLNGSEDLRVFNSASGVSQTIDEDEELEELELETKEVQQAQPVAVSVHSKYDPRVPTFLDPPNSVFRVKLVCTLLEVSVKSLVTKNNLPKLGAYLAAFQRYLFTKTVLPTEVEFALLDTFDALDSEWRKVSPAKDQKNKEFAGNEDATGFPRFMTWLDAHTATVANEESDSLSEMRARTRLESQAGNGDFGGDSNTITSDSYIDDDDLLDDDGEYDSGPDDAVSASDSEHVSGDEDVLNDNMDDQESNATGTADEDDSEEETDESDDASEEDFDEEAYMQQLEAEAFEAELRRVTMDALEKGKSTLRGGKVSDYMPTGSQFLKKKQSEMTESDSPSVALGGKEGISFSLLKKGNKGKMEAKQFCVPKDTNLAAVATKQDDAAAKERDMIKAKVLQYEAESAETTGGNVYIEQEKLTVIRNRPLSMDEIDKNFGTTGGNLQNPPGRRNAGGTHVSSARGATYLGGARGRGPIAGRVGRGSGRGRNSSGRGLV